MLACFLTKSGRSINQGPSFDHPYVQFTDISLHMLSCYFHNDKKKRLLIYPLHGPLDNFESAHDEDKC